LGARGARPHPPPHPPHPISTCAPRARAPPRPRAELTGLLLDRPVLDRFREDLDGFRGEALRILDGLGGDAIQAGVLRRLVDDTARLLLEPAPAPAVAPAVAVPA
ncbi:hypothetical protein ACFXO0_20135, partial [Streptomyces goshikiensis]